MKSLCVYCGSSIGNNFAYEEAARSLAKAMISEQIDLVYGGGNVGLMGIIADEMLSLGGKVIGVIPKALMDYEVGHRSLTHLYVVKDMHERKAKMAELANGFIAMPGGIGTLEELFEALTWSQLGFHDKPIGLLNVNGFYDGLIRFVQHLVKQGFLKPEHAALMMYEDDAPALMERFKSFVPKHQTKQFDQATAKTLLP
ncbi:MAG: LOG family protein [Burkholderiaceae bacterium]